MVTGALLAEEHQRPAKEDCLVAGRALQTRNPHRFNAFEALLLYPSNIGGCTERLYLSPDQAPVQGDYTVKSGQMTSAVAAALAAARNANRSQHAGTAAAAAVGGLAPGRVGDASVRFGRAHVATSEGFAQQFGPYAGAQACLIPVTIQDSSRDCSVFGIMGSREG